MTTESTPPLPPVPPPPTPFAPPPPQPPSAPPTPRPAERRAALPWVIAAAAVVVALACAGALVLTRADGSGGSSLTDAGRGGERGFPTPEAAVEYFAERVSAGDLGGALEVFTVESAVEGYSFEAESERIDVVMPVSWLPSSSAGYEALNVELRRGEVASQVRFLVRNALAPDLDFYASIELDDETTASDIVDALAPDGLAGFGVARVEVLEPALRGDHDPFQEVAESFGAEELREVAVLYETPNGRAVGGAEVMRYGDDWYLRSLTSALIGTSLGELTPASEAEYEELVAGVNG